MEIKDLNKKDLKNKNLNENLEKLLSTGKILKNPQLLSYITFSLILGISCFLYLPGLSNHLKWNYNLSIFKISSIFFFSQIWSLILSFLLYKLNLQSSIYLLYIASIFALISNIFIGPSITLQIPKSLTYSIFGFYSSFICNNLLFNNFIQILEYKTKILYPLVDKEIIEANTSVFNSILFSSSDFFGPFLGGIIFNYFGFGDGSLVWGIFVILISIIYLLINKK